MTRDIKKDLVKTFIYNKNTGEFFLKRNVGKGRNRQYKGDKIVGYLSPDGYYYLSINGEKILSHQVAHLLMTGKIPKIIDHLDRNRANNKWSNIKNKSSRSKNAQNTDNYINNTSGIKGIICDNKNNKWIAKIMINKKSFWLGRHSDFNEAVCHRLAAEQCIDWVGDSPAYLYVKENIQNV